MENAPARTSTMSQTTPDQARSDSLRRTGSDDETASKERLSARAIARVAALVLALAAAASADGIPPPGGRGVPCQDAVDIATRALHDSSPVGTRAIRSQIDDAFVLFRLGRTDEAKTALASALSLLDVTRRRLMTAAERDGVGRAVDALRGCMEASPAPPLATLTVHTYEEDDRAPDGRGIPAEPGALVRIDGTPVGRTARGGMFEGSVPSGSLHVTAEIPPSGWGEAFVDLAPGGAATVSIVIQSSKEITEETPLVLVEAEGGLLSAAARTLTLQFIAPDGAVRISRIDDIDLLRPEGDILEPLAPMFTLADGAIVAVDAAKVIRTIQARRTGPVVLAVSAADGELSHASRLEFRIE